MHDWISAEIMPIFYCCGRLQSFRPGDENFDSIVKPGDIFQVPITTTMQFNALK